MEYPIFKGLIRYKKLLLKLHSDYLRLICLLHKIVSGFCLSFSTLGYKFKSEVLTVVVSMVQ